MTPPLYEISVALPELLTFERNNKDFFIGIDLGVQETVYIQSNLLGRTPLGNGQVHKTVFIYMYDNRHYKLFYTLVLCSVLTIIDSFP